MLTARNVSREERREANRATALENFLKTIRCSYGVLLQG